MFLQVPEWLHKSLHWSSVDGVSPTLSFLSVSLSVAAVFCFLIVAFMNKVSNERPLKAKCAELDKKCFKLSNDYQILKREMEENAKNSLPPVRNFEAVQPPVVKEVPSKALKLRLDELKRENEVWLFKKTAKITKKPLKIANGMTKFFIIEIRLFESFE